MDLLCAFLVALDCLCTTQIKKIKSGIEITVRLIITFIIKTFRQYKYQKLLKQIKKLLIIEKAQLSHWAFGLNE